MISKEDVPTTLITNEMVALFNSLEGLIERLPDNESKIKALYHYRRTLFSITLSVGSHWRMKEKERENG